MSSDANEGKSSFGEVIGYYLPNIFGSSETTDALIQASTPSTSSTTTLITTSTTTTATSSPKTTDVITAENSNDGTISKLVSLASWIVSRLGTITTTTTTSTTTASTTTTTTTASTTTTTTSTTTAGNSNGTINKLASFANWIVSRPGTTLAKTTTTSSTTTTTTTTTTGTTTSTTSTTTTTTIISTTTKKSLGTLGKLGYGAAAGIGYYLVNKLWSSDTSSEDDDYGTTPQGEISNKEFGPWTTSSTNLDPEKTKQEIEEIYGPWTTASTIIDKEKVKDALSWEETKKNLIITDEQEEVDISECDPKVNKCDVVGIYSCQGSGENPVCGVKYKTKKEN